jgi:N-acetylneuraminate lyase
MKLHGIFPALHTASGPDEALDLATQRRLVRRLLDQGVHGLFVCGTSGEFPFLDLSEREAIAELVLSETAGQVPVVVHVAAPRPGDAVRLARHAARHGAQAVSCVPPYYFEYREDAVLEYFREVALATDLPFLAYHIPERTRFGFSAGFVEEVLKLPNLAGFKLSDGDLFFLERLAARASGRLALFSGQDEVLLPALAAGATGAIGSTFNFLAPVFLGLWKAFQAGDLATAAGAQQRANRIIAVLDRYPPIAASKAALSLLGLDCGPPRRPQSRLGAVEAKRLDDDLRGAGLFEVR